MHPLLYGARYGLLMAVDLSLFAWHGNRPMWWVRQMVRHRFNAPATFTGHELAALDQAKQRYPNRTCYVSLSSKYSPWYGNHFFNEVKVLVGDKEGAHPVRLSGGYGIPLSRFEEIVAERIKKGTN
jgi:hypothetical protein